MAKSDAKNQSDDNDPSDSVEVDVPVELNLMPPCPHLTKALNLSQVRKAIANGKLNNFSDCEECEKISNVREKDVEDEKESNGLSDMYSEEDLAIANAIYVCLQCGNRGCSRSSPHQHAVKHQNTPRSSSHDVAVNSHSWMVWCYRCDDFINANQTKPLIQAIQMLQSNQAKSTKKNNTKEFLQTPTEVPSESSVKQKTVVRKVDEAEQEDAVKVTIVKSRCEDLKRPKGLQNLGNTCFFNSVIQNLCQTHLLTDACIATVKDDVRWTVKPLGPSSVIRDLQTLDLSLGEAGDLTVALSELFKDMQFSTKVVLVPSLLLQQICIKSPQFRGQQQQDSHELLRHLFEGVFGEESKRMKSAVLEHFGLKKSIAPNKVKPHIRTQIDAFKKQTHHTLLESCFGGLLINTILCLRCRKSSQNFEPFVDLSLPIVEPKARKHVTPNRWVDPITRDIEERYGAPKKEGPSKHQLKLAKKQKRKRNRAKKQNAGGTAAKESTPDSIGSVSENGRTSDKDGESGSEEDDEPEDNSEIQTGDVDSILSKVTEIGINQQRRKSDENQSEIDSGIDFICPDDEEDHLLQKHKDVWKELSLSTLGDRTNCTAAPPNADHSVATCLAAFTEEELLTGKNKFGCDSCTEEFGEVKKDGKKERVYTDAQMQLLVLIPPAILTLHLKRFMQCGMQLRKNDARVSFPKVLDFAPYCSKACINLPSMKKGQTKILYSLYGIVEHSGSLYGGHYTAYVKVRPNDGSNTKFLQPFPLKMGLVDLIREMHKRCETQESPEDSPQEVVDEELKIPEGRWYHISDSSVAQVEEYAALDARAYLLFYERLS